MQNVTSGIILSYRPCTFLIILSASRSFISRCLGICSSFSPSVQISCLPPCLLNLHPSSLSFCSNALFCIRHQLIPSGSHPQTYTYTCTLSSATRLFLACPSMPLGWPERVFPDRLRAPGHRAGPEPLPARVPGLGPSSQKAFCECVRPAGALDRDLLVPPLRHGRINQALSDMQGLHIGPKSPPHLRFARRAAVPVGKPPVLSSISLHQTGWPTCSFPYRTCTGSCTPSCLR